MTLSPRTPEADVDPRFIDRWSPRVLAEAPVPPAVRDALFEAARWAPSAFNDQPWLFLYADTPDTLATFRPLLVEGNRAWADRAPLLLFLAARRHNRVNGKLNPHAAFDCGAAWMSLALEARRHGLYAHAMAGFKKDEAHAVLGLDPNDWELLVAIAVAGRGDPADGPERFRDEAPNPRRPLAEVAHRGIHGEQPA